MRIVKGPEYLIREYPLQQGSLEIAYIEEYFNEFPERKTAAEICERLEGRQFQILMAEAPVDDGSTVVPVSYKVSHELREEETDAKLKDLVERLRRHDRVSGPPDSVQLARRDPARLARPGALSRARPRSRKSGPSPRGSTKSSSRRRTAITTCAARSTACSSTSSSSSLRRQSRLEGLSQQAARPSVLNAHRSRRSVTRA